MFSFFRSFTLVGWFYWNWTLIFGWRYGFALNLLQLMGWKRSTAMDLLSELFGLKSYEFIIFFFVWKQMILSLKNTSFFSTNTPPNFQFLYFLASETKSTSQFTLFYLWLYEDENNYLWPWQHFDGCYGKEHQNSSNEQQI